MKGKYIVRIDNKANDIKPDKDTLESHFNYINNIIKNTEVYAGGFLNKPGGMIIFKDSNFDKIKEICENDPIIKKGYYKFELYEWETI